MEGLLRAYRQRARPDPEKPEAESCQSVKSRVYKNNRSRMLKKLFNGGLAWLLAITTIGPGLEWFWKAYAGPNDPPPPTLWALTCTLFLSILWLSATWCTHKHGVLSDEVERCAAAKRELEETLLTNRRSSTGRKKK